MKCFNGSVIVLSVAALSSASAACHAAPTVNEPANPAITAPPLSGTGTATGPLSGPQRDSRENHQPKARRTMPGQFFDQLQPAACTMLADSDAGTANLLDVKSVCADLAYDREPTPNQLSLPGLKYSNGAQPLLLAPAPAPAISLVNLNGKLNFQIFNPLAQTGRKNPALKIAGLSTRSWTSIVLRQPDESGFSDASICEPRFNLFCVGAEPEP